MRRLLFAMLPLLALGVVACTATRLQTSPREMERIAESLQGRRYTVEVVRVDPMGARPIDLDPGYGIMVRGDSIYSRLPFFGRAYSAPYGGGDRGGFFFDAKILDYQSTPGRRGSTEVRIETRDAEDSYTCFLTVWQDGGAQLEVESFNRQGIGYDGTLVPIE